MAYQIAYGTDTESIEDADQLMLLTLPDECENMESDDLIDFIKDNWGTADVSAEPLVGFNDVQDALRLILTALKGEVLTTPLIETVLRSLYDAVDNN